MTTTDELMALGLHAEVAKVIDRGYAANVATAGTVEANKAVVVDANKRIDTIVIADGGLKLGTGAGTAVTSTAAELNILDGVTATAGEVNTVAGVTPGTVTASKAVVVDANKRVDRLVIGDGGLSLGTGAGTAITATAAELNTLDGITSTTLELNILDGVTATSGEINTLAGVTAGTVAASKAAVVDANKDIGDFRNLDAVNLDAGASGTAGSVDVFPTTAAKGKLAITCADQTGDTTVTLTTAAMADARTLTIPDPGAAASFVMTEGAQTVAGAITFSGANVYSGNGTITGSLQNTKTTAVTADATPPVLTFTDGLNLVSFTTNADDIVHLPVNVAGDIGKEIEIYAVQGFELRSADASATLNNVIIGATNEAAFVAGTYAKLKLVADNTWLSVISTLIDGTQTKIVPDAV